MREYVIHNEQDFDDMVGKFTKHFVLCKKENKKFQSILITSKRYRKPKSSAQHRTYWKMINELKKEFKKVGVILNQDQIHQFVKRQSGFTDMFEVNGKMVMVEKSIADSSEDATSRDLSFLIDYMLRFAAEAFGVNIQIGVTE